MKRYTQDEVVQLLRDEMEKSGLKFVEFARRLGVSKQYLRNILTKKQMPGRRIGFAKSPDSIRFVRV